MKTQMRIILTVIFVVLSHSTVFGTVQVPDKIIYNGKEYYLHSNPMEDYFKKYPNKHPQRNRDTVIVSSDLWRGYVATFEIKNNQLYLKDIEIEVPDDTSMRDTKWKSVLKEVFPNQELVKVDWITGLLVMPYGEIVNYVHMGVSTYEHYILLEIHNGNLTKEKQFDYREYEEFKEKQFEAFKETDEYKKFKADLQEEYINANNAFIKAGIQAYYKVDDDSIDSFLRVSVIEYSSKILVE